MGSELCKHCNKTLVLCSCCRTQISSIGNLTLEEKKSKYKKLSNMGRQNTRWEKEIAEKCKHKWQPVRLEPASENCSQPDLKSAKCYVVCLKCCAWSYYELGWVGFAIGSPDKKEQE